MKKGLVVGLSVLGAIILIVVFSVANILSIRGNMIELEEQFKAQYVSNQSNYDSMWKMFKESAQVTDKQAEDFKEVYTSIISGRYDGDSGQLMQMIKEDNPQMSTELYTELQRQIESGRKTFDNNQKKVTDIIREYNTYIKKHFIVASILNKEPMNAEDYIVTSEKTDAAFQSGQDEEIKMFE